MYFISHPHHFIDFPRQRPFSHDDEYSHRPRNEASKKQSYGKRVKEVEGGLSPHWTVDTGHEYRCWDRQPVSEGPEDTFNDNLETYTGTIL